MDNKYLQERDARFARGLAVSAGLGLVTGLITVLGLAFTASAATLDDLANIERTAPVQRSIILDILAQMRANELCRTGQFSHDGFRLYSQISGFIWFGENLARGFTTNENMHAAFMASPAHRDNIVNRQYQYVGTGNACNVTVVFFAGM